MKPPPAAWPPPVTSTGNRSAASISPNKHSRRQALHLADVVRTRVMLTDICSKRRLPNVVVVPTLFQKAAAERGRGAHAVPTETAWGPAPPSLNAGARAEGLDANSLTAGPSDFPFAGFVDPEWLVEFEIDAIVPD
jgi:hypothetical protein